MKPKKIENRLTTVVEAWTNLRPTKSFFGLTLEQFKAAIQPSLDARGAVDEVRNNLTAAMVQRDDADAVSWRLAQRVVAAVVADEAEGDDGEFYRTMGFVRRSERASGLIRGRRKDAEQPQMAKAA